MISVRIPKEIREYKEKITLGLTARQLICSILALAVAVPLYIFGRKYLGDEFVSWAVIIIVCPLAAMGFIKKNGMPFEKFVATIFKSSFLYPTKRKYKTNSFFKDCQNQANTQEKLSQPKNYEKYKLSASLERCFLIEELKAQGVEFNMDEIGAAETLVTVKLPPTEKKKRGKNKKTNKQVDEKQTTIEKQYQKVEEKLNSDPHYVPTKAERKILLNYRNYVKAQQKKRIATVKTGVSKIAKQNNKLKNAEIQQLQFQNPHKIQSPILQIMTRGFLRLHQINIPRRLD